MSADFSTLESSTLTALQDLLKGVRQDLREQIEPRAQELAQEAIELGSRAASGDQEAQKTLAHLQAQGLMLLGKVASTEEARAIATAQVILSTAVKVALSFLVA